MYRLSDSRIACSKRPLYPAASMECERFVCLFRFYIAFNSCDHVKTVPTCSRVPKTAFLQCTLEYHATARDMAFQQVNAERQTGCHIYLFSRLWCDQIEE